MGRKKKKKKEEGRSRKEGRRRPPWKNIKEEKEKENEGDCNTSASVVMTDDPTEIVDAGRDIVAEELSN